MKSFLFSFLFSLMIFSACETYKSEDVNQQKISTDYEVHYYSDENETVVSATFMFQNAYLKLTDPASIVFDGIPLKKKKALGATYYELTYSGSESGTFVYTDQDGTTYSNYAEMAEPVAVDSISLSVSDGGTVFWTGSPLDETESMELNINNGSSGFSKSTSAINATSITLQKGEISSDLEGSVSIYLIHSQRSDLEESTTKGGKIITRYSSDTYSGFIHN